MLIAAPAVVASIRRAAAKTSADESRYRSPRLLVIMPPPIVASAVSEGVGMGCGCSGYRSCFLEEGKGIMIEGLDDNVVNGFLAWLVQHICYACR